MSHDEDIIFILSMAHIEQAEAKERNSMIHLNLKAHSLGPVKISEINLKLSEKRRAGITESGKIDTRPGSPTVEEESGEGHVG